MTTPPTTPRRMRATCPEDLLAFVPVAIGFDPADSVVMLTLEGERAFHARVDLPEDEDDVDDVVEALLRPARRHRLTRVVFVIYDDDTATADETAWALHAAFTGAGVEVFEVLRVHDGHYFAVLPGRPRSAYRGVAFETRHHPFTAEAVFAGKVTHRSRDALAATLTQDPVESAAVEAVLDSCAVLAPHRVRALVSEHAAASATTPPEVVAALLVSVAEGGLRDEAWRWLSRATAASYVDFWADLVRRSPVALVPGPASVLAFTAWLAGDGALAWCAVDRARAVEPGHTLAGLVADMLTSATSPEEWDGLADRMRGVA